jgi:ABC-type polysaccharide/polyol phosphate transport system ATPase subunit
VTWAIELRGVSKAFRIRHNATQSIKVRLIGLVDSRQRERRHELWVLRDIDLAVRRGEWVGLIGSNGSGKSTLLRVMAGIYHPSAGRVIVEGRVAPVIELGVGFHPDLTGRENVHLSTSLYGLSRRETDRLYPRVVAFAELGDFVEAPLKTYSMGMCLRLGFSIAAHLDPDLLLVDEVLSVGDEPFQQKCLRRMDELRRRGTTVILVSHSMRTMERMCDRACLLVRGRLGMEGEPAKVVACYRETLRVTGPAGWRPEKS